jgi:hypothetical protein
VRVRVCGCVCVWVWVGVCVCVCSSCIVRTYGRQCAIAGWLPWKPIVVWVGQNRFRAQCMTGYLTNFLQKYRMYTVYLFRIYIYIPYILYGNRMYTIHVNGYYCQHYSGAMVRPDFLESRFESGCGRVISVLSGSNVSSPFPISLFGVCHHRLCIHYVYFVWLSHCDAVFCAFARVRARTTLSEIHSRLDQAPTYTAHYVQIQSSFKASTTHNSLAYTFCTRMCTLAPHSVKMITVWFNVRSNHHLDQASYSDHSLLLRFVFASERLHHFLWKWSPLNQASYTYPHVRPKTQITS